MIMQKLFLVLVVITLAACRANPPRTDAETSNSRPYAAERSSTDDSAHAVPQTASGGGAYLAGDGPGTDIPANLERIPDAVPHAEPLHRYANRPYTVLGKNYTPLTQTGSYKEQGVASWYGKKFHGQKTSIGEIYDMYGMTAAHTTLPIPSYARVTNLANNKSVIVRVNDRGPFLHERIIDLSYTAAAKLGIIGKGQGQVEVESLNGDENTSAPISPIYKEAVAATPLPVNTPSASGKIYLQLGAFKSQSGADDFLRNMRTKLGDNEKPLSLTHINGLAKVRIGPYSSADIARAAASKLETRLGFKPMLSLR